MIDTSRTDSQLTYAISKQTHPYMITAMLLIGCEIDYTGVSSSFIGLIIDVVEENNMCIFCTDDGMGIAYLMPCRIEILHRYAYGLDEA